VSGAGDQLAGRSIAHNAETDWVPWGEGGARAKVLGSADGYVVALVQAVEGYRGTPHQHAYAEFLYVVNGRLQNQGQELISGDGYAAAAGSTHDDFEALEASTYLSIFRI
jgi:anti-sigma factor ChrR (cupin superfamily)